MSALIKNGHSILKVIKELEKCQILCANCHRRKTFEQSNSWRLTFEKDFKHFEEVEELELQNKFQLFTKKAKKAAIWTL